MKKTILFIIIVFSGMLLHAQTYDKQTFCNMYQEHLDQLFKTTKVTYEESTIVVTMDIAELAKFSEISVADARSFVSDKKTVDTFAKSFIEFLGAYNSAERKVVNDHGFYSLKAIYRGDYNHQFKKYESSVLRFYK